MEIARTEAIDRLFESILSLGSIDECYEYFEDLCTVKEITDMSQRLEAAVKLDEGVSYQKIQESMKISSATIGRVNRCLSYGTGGYKKIIERLRTADKK
ncbi:trpR family protein YerC/YecD [Anaerotruncus sp. CAG:390]|nr:trpR family protein YerC/YecD [Anaerotruncus sp. CAG:390]